MSHLFPWTHFSRQLPGTDSFENQALCGGTRTAGLGTFWIAAISVALCLPGTSLSAAQLFNPIPAPIAKSPIQIELVTVAQGLTAPNVLTFAPGDTANRQFVVDQPGQLRVIKDGQLLATPFLDLATTDALIAENHILAVSPNYDERGFLGAAFHPGFTDPQSVGFGKFYTYHSAPVGAAADFTVPLPEGVTFNNQSLIYEWTVNDVNADVFSGTSREVMRIDEPQSNHNGGMISFGQDGNLYVGLGDGGQADDQGNGHSAQGNGQDLSNVLGTILRIDPTDTSSGNYGIPATNPFVGQEPVPAEIFLYGLRNPFRFGFHTDPATGARNMIIGDVPEPSASVIACWGILAFIWGRKRLRPSTGSHERC